MSEILKIRMREKAQALDLEAVYAAMGDAVRAQTKAAKAHLTAKAAIQATRDATLALRRYRDDMGQAAFTAWSSRGRAEAQSRRRVVEAAILALSEAEEWVMALQWRAMIILASDAQSRDWITKQAFAIDEITGRRRLLEARAMGSELQGRTANALDVMPYQPPQAEGEDYAYAMLSRSSCRLTVLYADGMVTYGALRAARRYARLTDMVWGAVRLSAMRFDDAPRGDGEAPESTDLKEEWKAATACLSRKEQQVLEAVMRYGESTLDAAMRVASWRDRVKLQGFGDGLLVSAAESLQAFWAYADEPKRVDSKKEGTDGRAPSQGENAA